MKLGEDGEARIRGYLFVLGRSLRSFLPEPVVLDALREIESHVRERVAAVDPTPDERTALERVLAELGPPLKVARAYSAEMILEEAVAGGGVGATLRAVWHLATSSVLGFLAALGLFLSSALGAGLLVVAVAAPLFPDRVGLLVVDGIPRSLGIPAQVPAGGVLLNPWWLAPLCALLGLVLLVASFLGARGLLTWWRSRSRRRRELTGGLPPRV